MFVIGTRISLKSLGACMDDESMLELHSGSPHGFRRLSNTDLHKRRHKVWKYGSSDRGRWENFPQETHDQFSLCWRWLGLSMDTLLFVLGIFSSIHMRMALLCSWLLHACNSKNVVHNRMWQVDGHPQMVAVVLCLEGFIESMRKSDIQLLNFF